MAAQTQCSFISQSTPVFKLVLVLSISVLHTCYRCENEVVKCLARLPGRWQSEERVEGLSPHLLVFLAFQCLSVGTEELFLDQENAVEALVGVTLLRLLILLEPESSAEERLLANEAISFCDLFHQSGLLLARDSRLQQDEISQHLAVVNQARRAGVQVAEQGHEFLGHVLFAPPNRHVCTVSNEVCSIV